MSDGEDTRLYLVVIGREGERPEADLSRLGDAMEVQEGVHLLRTDAERSPAYHEIKRALPDGTALLVAPVDGEPKFKGQAEGALAWLRETR